jgi:hypothetical protein
MNSNSVHHVRPKAIAGESILGYLKRLAQVIDVNKIHITLQDGTPANLVKSVPFRENLSTLAQSLSNDWEVLAPQHMRPTGDGMLFAGHILPRDMAYMDRMRVCPACLADSPHHRQLWHLVPVDACHLHGISLIEQCQACRADLDWNSKHINECPACGASVSSMTSQTAKTDHMEIADLFAKGTGLSDLPNSFEVPTLLEGLSLRDQTELLRFLGRIDLFKSGARPGKGRPSAEEIMQLIVRGYSVVRQWPQRFLDGLSHLKQKNGSKGRSAHHLLDPYYTEILEAPAEGWGGRVRPFLIDFLGDHPSILVKSKTPIFHEVMRAKMYVGAAQAMEMLGVDAEEFERLQKSDLWGLVQISDALETTGYRIGTLVKLRRMLNAI